MIFVSSYFISFSFLFSFSVSWIMYFMVCWFFKSMCVKSVLMVFDYGIFSVFLGGISIYLCSVLCVFDVLLLRLFEVRFLKTSDATSVEIGLKNCEMVINSCEYEVLFDCFVYWWMRLLSVGYLSLLNDFVVVIVFVTIRTREDDFNLFVVFALFSIVFY